MKSDNDLTKLARWAIPGWIAILAFILFVFLDFTMSHPWTDISSDETLVDLIALITAIDPVSGILASVLIVLAGVPFGFAIYQVYFFIRWNSPFARDGFLMPFVPGRMQELDEIIKDIDLLKLADGSKWREDYINDNFYRLNHAYRSWYQESYFFEAVQFLDTKFDGASIYARYRYLHEIVHTLGASLLAIYLAFIGYVLIKFYVYEKSLVDYLIVIAIFAGIYFFLQNLEYHRIANFNKSSNKDMDYIPIFQIKIVGKKIFSREINTKMYITFPAVHFIVFLLFVQFWGNPLLSQNAQMLDLSLLTFGLKLGFQTALKAIISLIIILSAFTLTRKDNEVTLGNVMTLGISFVLAVTLSLIPVFVKWVDWPFFVSLCIFLIGNLILLNNRRNAKEHSFSLQYYVMQQYIDSNNTPL